MLDLTQDPVALTAALVDVPSVSGAEQAIADLVQEALEAVPTLQVVRDGNVVVARTSLGRERRVLLAGHLDTVPIADNLPSRLDGFGRLFGCGTSDMKSGDAVLLHLAATLPDPAYDLTFVLYDNEEVEADRNGLNRIVATRASCSTPTSPCSWSRRTAPSRRLPGHAARPGRDPRPPGPQRPRLARRERHPRRAPLLTLLVRYDAREVEIDGCTYREGLNAVRVEGGVAGNVIPDACTVLVNFRFAPDRTEEQAYDHVRSVLQPYAVELLDSAPGALPGLSAPAAAHFVEALGGTAVAKFGWTDVARFAALGIPAVNFGPGDPNLAHTREESVETAKIIAAERALRAYLS
jgi:succinyl-diaminopimelate desuccinylase